MNATASQPYESNLYLSLAGVPAVGIAHSNVLVSYKKFMGSALQVKSLSTEDWVEIGDGFYSLRWTPTEMDTLGKFFFKAEGPGFDNFLYGEFDVVAPPVAEVVYPERCVVYGNILELNVQPSTSTIITARIVKVPAVINQSILTAKITSTTPNHLGNFELILPRGATVVIEIPMTGIRQQIVVPNQAQAHLLDLLPPLT